MLFKLIGDKAGIDLVFINNKNTKLLPSETHQQFASR